MKTARVVGQVVATLKHRDLDGIVDGQLFLTLHAITQRLAIDIGHDVVEEPVRFTGIEEWNDVRVIELCGDTDLLEKSLVAECLSKFRLEHLDGHLAVVFQVCSQIHGCHSTFTEFADDGVARRQCRLDAR